MAYDGGALYITECADDDGCSEAAPYGSSALSVRAGPAGGGQLTRQAQQVRAQQVQGAAIFATELPEAAGRGSKASVLPCCAGFSFTNRKKPGRCRHEANEELVWCSEDCRASFCNSWAFLTVAGTEGDRKCQEHLFGCMVAWRAARGSAARAAALKDLNWSVLNFTSAVANAWKLSIDQANGPEKSVWNLLVQTESSRTLLENIAHRRAEVEAVLERLLRS